MKIHRVKNPLSRPCLFSLIVFGGGLLAMSHPALAEAKTTLTPLTDAQAWKKLPAPEHGAGSPLPGWARQLAETLPKTTASLLQLDYVQRLKSPIDPPLRAAMRWVAAHANGCDYAKQVALADAERIGVSSERIAALGQPDYPGWSPAEQLALEFARKMTVASESVTDAEFADLVTHFGEKKTASMVLLMAYSNFQDRLLICLQTPFNPLEDGVPPPALEFAPNSLMSKMPPPPASPPLHPTLPPPTGKDLIADDEDWSRLTYDTLQNRLESQRQRQTRLPIPEWPVIQKNVPPALFSKPSDIVWYRIVFGYAPELALPYEYFMRTAGAETAPNYNRVFGQSLFWITTRAIGCPYCMGHCEMNWEVAGLTQKEIAERSRLLSGNDWSSFPEQEQIAFAFARKLTRSPGSINSEDIQGLRSAFGPEKALIVMLHASRHHYMTRISNGFQLTLERENVFYDYWNIKRPQK